MKRESLVAASDIVRTRARLTKIRPRPSWNLPHSVADEFLECGRLFEEAHRRDVKRAALAYDGFVRGELIDTAPDIKRSYEKLLDDVKRNRLCIGSIDSDTLLAGKPKAPGPKSGGTLSEPLQAALDNAYNSFFAATDSSLVGSSPFPLRRSKSSLKKRMRQVTVGGSGLTAAAVAGTLNQEQFYELMDDIAPVFGLDTTSSGEMVDLWKAANAVDGNPANERASASAITICLLPQVPHIPLNLLSIVDLAQHYVDVEWTWMGLPEIRWKMGHWELHPDSGTHFHLEVARISPAYGIRPWRIAATPTRRLSARALVAPQANWEEHVGAGEITGGSSADLKPFLCCGAAEDYALRVCAVNRGGSSPYSNVVIARPARSRAEIELDLPGPLPQSVRDVLDMEDQFRDEEKQSGLSALEQFEQLREVLGRQVPELSQLFRLFSMTQSKKLDHIYSLTQPQFQGFCIAIGISPSLVDQEDRIERVLPPGLVQNILKRAMQENSVGEVSKAMERIGLLKRVVSSTITTAEICFTQFVSAIIRVAHAAYAGQVTGLGAQMDMLMTERVLPVHRHIALPSRFDRFLRSRAAVCVFIEHDAALKAIFRRFSTLNKSAWHERVHCETLDLGEWLQLLTAAGLFEDVMHRSIDDADWDLSEDFTSGMPRFSHLVATRIFVEVNLEDIQLDMVPRDAAHLHSSAAAIDEHGLYAEVVFEEFCLCVGSLMPFSPRVLRRSVRNKPTVTHAELLDEFIREDFIPRCQRITVIPTADEVKAQQTAYAFVQRQQSTEPREADDWLELAARGGPQRRAISELMLRHEFGFCLTKLAAQAQSPDK